MRIWASLLRNIHGLTPGLGLGARGLGWLRNLSSRRNPLKVCCRRLTCILWQSIISQDC